MSITPKPLVKTEATLLLLAPGLHRLFSKLLRMFLRGFKFLVKDNNYNDFCQYIKG